MPAPARTSGASPTGRAGTPARRRWSRTAGSISRGTWTSCARFTRTPAKSSGKRPRWSVRLTTAEWRWRTGGSFFSPRTGTCARSARRTARRCGARIFPSVQCGRNPGRSCPADWSTWRSTSPVPAYTYSARRTGPCCASIRTAITASSCLPRWPAGSTTSQVVRRRTRRTSRSWRSTGWATARRSGPSP